MTVDPLPADEGVCPLCGEANDCAVDSGVANCWCFSKHLDGDLVAWLAARGIDGACLCEVCAAEGVRSPCLEVCSLEPDDSTCRGCGRTSREISRWSSMTPVERARVRLRLRGLRG
ncbi:MAG: cysteine-rich CWC family protein [Planctomycetota bacterium]|nr:cysteine-rich CWC family protein [Planctomycetota bacterium]